MEYLLADSLRHSPILCPVSVHPRLLLLPCKRYSLRTLVRIILYPQCGNYKDKRTVCPIGKVLQFPVYRDDILLFDKENGNLYFPDDFACIVTIQILWKNSRNSLKLDSVDYDNHATHHSESGHARIACYPR